MFETVNDGGIGHTSHVYALAGLEDHLQQTFQFYCPRILSGGVRVFERRKEGSETFAEHGEDYLRV